MLGKWPVSKNRGPVVKSDLSDAWILYAHFTVLFDKADDVKSMEDYDNSIQNFTEFWAGVPGLRTKNFTSIQGTNTGTGIYLFKSRDALD